MSPEICAPGDAPEATAGPVPGPAWPADVLRRAKSLGDLRLPGGNHLHEFRLVDAEERAVVAIGIPTDDDPQERPVVPGWVVRVSTYFDPRAWHAPPATYAYAFGDDWEHVVLHEGMVPGSVDSTLSVLQC